MVRFLFIAFFSVNKIANFALEGEEHLKIFPFLYVYVFLRHWSLYIMLPRYFGYYSVYYFLSGRKVTTIFFDLAPLTLSFFQLRSPDSALLG